MADSTNRKRLEILVKTIGLKRAIKELEQANKASDLTATQQNKIRRAQVGVAEATSNSTKAFAKQAQGLGGLVRTYATWAANIFAISAAFGALKRNADFEILIRQTEQLSAVSGIAYNSMANQLKELTAGALNFKEALQTTSVGLNAGLSTEQLGALTEGAAKLAQTLGRDVAESVNRVIRGVVKGESELLDELGIVLRLDRAYTDYAKTLGKTSQELTIYEKQQALAVEVMEQMEQKTKDISLLENPYSKLAASLSELSNSLISMVSGPLSSFANFFSQNLTALLPIVTLALLKFADKTVLESDNIQKSVERNQAAWVSYTKAFQTGSNIITAAINRLVYNFKLLNTAASISFKLGGGRQGPTIPDDMKQIAEAADAGAGKMKFFGKAVLFVSAGIGRFLSGALRAISIISMWAIVLTAVGTVLVKVGTYFGIFNDQGKESRKIMSDVADKQKVLAESQKTYNEAMEKSQRTNTDAVANMQLLANITENQAGILRDASRALKEFATADWWDVLIEKFKATFGAGIYAKTRDVLKQKVIDMFIAGEEIPLLIQELIDKNVSDRRGTRKGTETQTSIIRAQKGGTNFTPDEIKNTERFITTLDRLVEVLDELSDSNVSMSLSFLSDYMEPATEQTKEWAASLAAANNILESGSDIIDSLFDKLIQDSPYKKNAESMQALANEALKLQKILESGGAKSAEFQTAFKDMIGGVDTLFAARNNISLNEGDFFSSVVAAAEKANKDLSVALSRNLAIEEKKLEILSLNEQVNAGIYQKISDQHDAQKDLLILEQRKNKLEIDAYKATLPLVEKDAIKTEVLKAQIDVLKAQNAVYEEQKKAHSDIIKLEEVRIAAIDIELDAIKERAELLSAEKGLLESIAGSTVSTRSAKAQAQMKLQGIEYVENERTRLKLEKEIARVTSEIAINGDRKATTLALEEEKLKLQNMLYLENEASLLRQQELREKAADAIIASNDFSVYNFGEQIGAAFTRSAQEWDRAMGSHVENVQRVVLNTFDAGIDEFTTALVNDGEITTEGMKEALRTTLADITADYLKSMLRNALSMFDPQTIAIKENTAALYANTAALGGAAAGSSGGGAGFFSSMFSAIGSLFTGGSSGGTGTGAQSYAYNGELWPTIEATPLPPMASGGITSGPVLAGEGNLREAVVPLPDNRSIPVNLGGEIGNNYVVNQSFDFRGTDQSTIVQLRREAKRIQQQTINTLLNDINRGGPAAKITGRRR